MDSRELVKKSKLLSRVLRHRPESIGLQLDEHGWADVDELLGKLLLTRSALEDIVRRGDKQRFVFSADGKKIRGNQGHSIAMSKLLSRVLRHRPESVGLQLDEHGWAHVDELLEKVRLTRTALENIVRRSDKKRFVFSADGKKIRANHGHSISIDLAMQACDPPPVLYHGTARRSVDSILATGLHSGRRQHVHLSTDFDRALKVGKKRGEPAVVTVDAARMAQDGFVFYQSENGVWLTNGVEAKYVTSGGEQAE